MCHKFTLAVVAYENNIESLFPLFIYLFIYLFFAETFC